MQFSIKPVDMHHYEVFMLHPVQAKLFGKTHEKTYMGYVTISLNGENIDVYCENNRMKSYSNTIGEQTYSIYVNSVNSLN